MGKRLATNMQAPPCRCSRVLRSVDACCACRLSLGGAPVVQVRWRLNLKQSSEQPRLVEQIDRLHPFGTFGCSVWGPTHPPSVAGDTTATDVLSNHVRRKDLLSDVECMGKPGRLNEKRLKASTSHRNRSKRDKDLTGFAILRRSGIRPHRLKGLRNSLHLPGDVPAFAAKRKQAQ